MPRSTDIAIVIAIAACREPSPRPPTKTVEVTLAAVGLEAASLDRSVDPCVDAHMANHNKDLCMSRR